jgi:hypothetical protein
MKLSRSGSGSAERRWTPKGCGTYLHVPDAKNESATYVLMAEKIIAERADVSYSVYTQTTDLENECDGFLNYDRVSKFTPEQVLFYSDGGKCQRESLSASLS